MSGPQYKKKLEKKWKPVVFDTKEPTYTDPPKKDTFFKGIKIGGNLYGKKDVRFNFLKMFNKGE